MSDDISFTMPDRRRAIFLDRITTTLPTYPVFGKTQCFGCNRWCWLGEEPMETVSSGAATPYCLQCGAEMARSHEIVRPS